jgi:hypothetical protein
MRDVAVRYAALPIPITNLGGNLRLTRGRLAFEGVSGRCAGGSLRVGGWVDRGQSRRTGEIDIAFSQLRADDAFHDALPPGWRDRIGAFRVRGPIDGSVRATTDTDEDDLHWAVTANALLVDVDVEHPFVPLPLRGVRGSVDFADGRVRCDRLDARYDRAALRASFSIETSPEGPVGEVSLSATDLPLDRATRDLGPPQLRAVWDRIEPVGAVDLDIASLRVEPVEPDGAQRWIVDGAAQLHDVTLRGVEGVDGLTGRVVAQGMAVDRLGGTALAGRLTNARARVRGRELDHVDADWSLLRTTDGGGRLALTNAQAELYDGSVSGGAELLFDTESARYNLSTTMQGVRLRPLLVRVGGAVDDRATTGPADAMEVDGSVDAHAYLSGELGRPASRRGGGRVEIVDGHLYHLPIVVAILHVLNLSLPRQGALEEAEASFFLVGDRCDLQDIRLRGDDLALVGHGTMSLPDLGVDLRLINVGPRDWVRLPALADFVDGVSRRLLELQITGPIDRPTVRTQALRAIGDEFKRLFNKRRPPKVQRVSK